MFLEFETTRNEKVFLNVNHILFVTTEKNKTIIIDINGADYETTESYDSICSRLSIIRKN